MEFQKLIYNSCAISTTPISLISACTSLFKSCAINLLNIHSSTKCFHTFCGHNFSGALTMGSPFSSFWLEFGCAESGGGVTEEQLFMFGGVVALGEPLGPQLTPPTLCWYIMESPAGKITRHIINKPSSKLHRCMLSHWFTRILYSVL